MRFSKKKIKIEDKIKSLKQKESLILSELKYTTNNTVYKKQLEYDLRQINIEIDKLKQN